MNIHNVDWEAIDWTPVRHGVDRKAFSGEGATLALHRLQLQYSSIHCVSIPTSLQLWSCSANTDTVMR